MTEVAIGFNEEGYAEYRQIAREVSRRMMNDMLHRGRWQQKEGLGGGVHQMWFTIQGVLCPDGYDVVQKTLQVVPLWYTGKCGRKPPGQDDDGTWHVYDICQYLKDQVDSELLGTIGRATYFYPYTADDYDPPPCVPAWILADLCHQPEC